VTEARGSDLDRVYAHRFGRREAAAKDAMWAEVVHYLARWIPANSAVIDIACDEGYFIRHVAANERWATDLRDVRAALGDDIRFVQADGRVLSTAVPADHFDVAFMSNYLEHLATPDDVIRQLREARNVVKPGGRVIVLQPNIRYVGAAYWDFIDHRVALTERSLAEAATTAGLTVEHVIPRFLPYTTKSRLPQRSSLVRWYLRFPLAWRILGKQTLLVARRER